MRSVFPAGFFILIIAILGTFGAAHADARQGVEWQAGETLYIAGRDLTFDHAIDGSLTATGETISLTRDARIAKDVWIAGRRVAFEGDVGGELAVRAQDALINGHVKGDVSFYGVHLAFGPDARIDGDVRYYATTPAEIDAGAVIRGNMRASTMQGDGHMREHHARGTWRDRMVAPGYRLSWPGAVLFGVMAGLVALVAPAGAARLGEAGMAQPLLSFVIGAAWLVGTPILALFSALTIIGLPLALIVMLLWPLGMLAGLVVAVIVLGEAIAGRLNMSGDSTARRIAGIALSTFILWIGISLPALGVLVWFGSVTIGIGAMALAGRARYVGL